MADLDEEGFDFVKAFEQKFAASPASTQARLKAERIAGLTPKQRARARAATPKKQVNFRASQETRALIKSLAAHLKISDTDVMEAAVAALARQHPLPKGGAT